MLVGQIPHEEVSDKAGRVKDEQLPLDLGATLSCAARGRLNGQCDEAFLQPLDQRLN